MIGNADIRMNGSPVGRVIVDTNAATMRVIVLELSADSLVASILASLPVPPGFSIEIERIKEDHFFDLFTKS